MAEVNEFPDKMQFGVFVFVEAPETFRMEAVREPVYTQDAQGEQVYAGMGPVCRVISGSGIFRGEYAYESFNTLHVLMHVNTPQDLYHPLWGTYSALLCELTLTNTSRKDYLEYTFTFREADTQGTVPKLPEHFYN